MQYLDSAALDCAKVNSATTTINSKTLKSAAANDEALK